MNISQFDSLLAFFLGNCPFLLASCLLFKPFTFLFLLHSILYCPPPLVNKFQDIDNLIYMTQHLNCGKPFLELKTDNMSIKQIHNMILIDKLISDCSFTANIIQAALTKSWNTRRDFQVTPKGNNMYLFSFSQEVDIRLVMEQRPWSINNQLLSLCDWPLDIPLEDLSTLHRFGSKFTVSPIIN